LSATRIIRTASDRIAGLNRRREFTLLAAAVVLITAIVGVTQLQGKPKSTYSADVVAALLAGIYPAIRRGHIQPAEAVRAE
jgi:hypothetical protein